jgi:SAM-dependent methyltransferase
MELSWPSQLRESAYEDFFSRLRKRGCRAILDLSAGYDLVTYVSGKGFEVSSIDTKKDVLDAGRAHRTIAIAEPSDAFEAVLCLGTFDYLARDVAPVLASEIERLLRPGGIVFLSFAPVWAQNGDAKGGAPKTVFDGHGNAYRRVSGHLDSVVVYQTREIEGLFRRFRIVSLVTQTNGTRRLLATKKEQP